MRRLLGVTLGVIFLTGSFVFVGTPSVSPEGVTLEQVSASAASCNQWQHNMAYRHGGDCWNWSKKTDRYGKLVGANFYSKHHDHLVTAPRKGRLDTACGQIWSTKSKTRRIMLRKATWWKYGARTKLTSCVLDSRQAANKYRTGSGSARHWSFIRGSESTGWAWNGPERRIYVPFGFVDHQFGKSWPGQWTPPVKRAGAHRFYR